MRSVFALVIGPVLLATNAGCALLSGVGDLEIDDCDGGCVASGDDATTRVDTSTSDGSHPSDGSGGVDASKNESGTALDAADDTGSSDSGGDAVSDATSDATTDAGDASTTGPCPGTAGPTPVRVGTFCIDSTEVTNDQYAAFLASNPASGLAPPACAFRTSFVPTQSWPVSNKGTYPVVFVDWCDAYAYCNWAGKRLCGAIGGGPSSRASAADKTVDAWYAACSKNGANVYPYGGTQFVSGKCNEAEAHTNSTRPVGSFSGCVGGFSGIFDMNGNAWEWVDACDVSAGASDACLIRGGSWLFAGATYGGCPTYFNDYTVKRSDSFNDTGFRCCSK